MNRLENSYKLMQDYDNLQSFLETYALAWHFNRSNEGTLSKI